MQSTSVRIDGETHEELKRLADELGTTVGRTVGLAVRALRQDRVGEQLVSRYAPMRRPGSMLTSGDVVDLDLGLPEGREAGFRHPAVVVSAQRILTARPTVVYVVPLTSTVRGFHAEITIEPDRHNGLTVRSAAQCQHLRAGSTGRIVSARGNVGHSDARPRSARRSRSCWTSLFDLVPSQTERDPPVVGGPTRPVTG